MQMRTMDHQRWRRGGGDGVISGPEMKKGHDETFTIQTSPDATSLGYRQHLLNKRRASKGLWGMWKWKKVPGKDSTPGVPIGFPHLGWERQVPEP